jgi:hypothetical protein
MIRKNSRSPFGSLHSLRARSPLRTAVRVTRTAVLRSG